MIKDHIIKAKRLAFYKPMINDFHTRRIFPYKTIPSEKTWLQIDLHRRIIYCSFCEMVKMINHFL